MKCKISLSFFITGESYLNCIKEIIEEISTKKIFTVEFCDMRTDIFGDYFEIMNCLNDIIYRKIQKFGATKISIKTDVEILEKQ